MMPLSPKLSLLVSSARYNDMKQLQELLAQPEVDVNCAERRRGHTALHKACWAGNPSCVLEILKHSPSMEQRSSRGDTALEIAVWNSLGCNGKIRGGEHNFLECARLMRNAGAVLTPHAASYRKLQQTTDPIVLTLRRALGLCETHEPQKASRCVAEAARLQRKRPASLPSATTAQEQHSTIKDVRPRGRPRGSTKLSKVPLLPAAVSLEPGPALAETSPTTAPAAPSECVICLERPRTHILLPCGHRHYCGACAEKFQKRPRHPRPELAVCCTCREVVLDVKYVYD